MRAVGHPRRVPDVTSESNLLREYEALIGTAGFRLHEDRLVVRVSGEDRSAFIHGMCSNDIIGLKAGAAVEALILTEHAHVITSFYALARPDDLLLETSRQRWPQARAHLEKLIVADDVEIEELDTTAVIAILGPKSAQATSYAADESVLTMEPWRHVTIGAVTVANLPRFGSPGFAIFADRARAATILVRLGSPASGAIEVSEDAIDTVRIEHGIARIGVDTNDKTIALEARLQPAISFAKGCYVGQETIERATARGGLKKRLFGLRLEDGQLPALNACVMLDGTEVGRVSSAALSPRLGAIALATLHHSAWPAGTIVKIAGPSHERVATVSDLPFSTS